MQRELANTYEIRNSLFHRIIQRNGKTRCFPVISRAFRWSVVNHIHEAIVHMGWQKILLRNWNWVARKTKRNMSLYKLMLSLSTSICTTPGIQTRLVAYRQCNAISIFGVPSRIIADQGRCFTSSEFRNFCNTNKMDLHVIAQSVKIELSQCVYVPAEKFTTTTYAERSVWLLKIEWITVTSTQANAACAHVIVLEAETVLYRSAALPSPSNRKYFLRPTATNVHIHIQNRQKLKRHVLLHAITMGRLNGNG